MPSFVCDRCQETLKKPKLDAHVGRCRGASFSCIDCYKSFKGVEYRDHFSCISEVEKYEKRKPRETNPVLAEEREHAIKSKKVESESAKSSSREDSSTYFALMKDTLKFRGPLSLRTLQKILKKENKVTKSSFKRQLLPSIRVSLDVKQELSFTFQPGNNRT